MLLQLVAQGQQVLAVGIEQRPAAQRIGIYAVEYLGNMFFIVLQTGDQRVEKSQRAGTIGIFNGNDEIVFIIELVNGCSQLNEAVLG